MRTVSSVSAAQETAGAGGLLPLVAGITGFPTFPGRCAGVCLSGSGPFSCFVTCICPTHLST